MTYVSVNPAPRRTMARPAVNVVETPDSYRLEFFAPGFAKEEFTLEVHDDTLTVRGERAEAQKEEEGVVYLRRDFRPRAFERRFQLPEQVDAGAISAEYAQGILRVALPFRPEAPQVRRRIEIG